jgi:hypothetical protein
MTRAVHTEMPKVSKSTNRRLAFGVLAAPTAWLIHEIAGVAIVGRNCQLAEDISSWQWVALTGLTVFAAALAIAGGLSAFRVFRRYDPAGRVTRAEGCDRVEFVALFGIFISAFLLLNIIYFGVMPLVVEPCLRVT